MAKARKYTMPQTVRESRPGAWEGTGYKQYDQSSNLQDQLKLLESDRKLLESDRIRVQKELDELKIKRQNFDLLSVNVPEQTDEDKENIQAGQFRAGAEAMMEYDPATAQSWLLRADEIEARKQARATGTSPSAIRQQLRMARDRAYESYKNDKLDDNVREISRQEMLLLTAEMAKPNPSDIDVYAKIDKLYADNGIGNGGATTYGMGGTTGGNSFDNLSSEIATTIGNIKYKGKSLDDAKLALQRKVDTSGLSQTDITRLTKQLDDAVATKGGAPKATDVDKEVDKLFGGSSTEPIPADYGRYSKAFNAYNAAKSAFESGAVGASIGNFLYSLRPESVNEGDVELAKNSVRSGDQQALKTVLDKVDMGGLLTTDYKTLATQLGRAAYNKLIEDRKENTDQIVAIMDKLNPDKVRKRALTYYKLPNKLSGDSAKSDNKSGTVIIPGAGIVVKKGTVRTSGGRKFKAKRDLTATEANKSSNYDEVK